MITESPPTDQDSSDPRTQAPSAVSIAPSSSISSNCNVLRSSRETPSAGSTATNRNNVPVKPEGFWPSAFSIDSSSAAAVACRYPWPAAGPSSSATKLVAAGPGIADMSQPLPSDRCCSLCQCRYWQIPKLRGEFRRAIRVLIFSALPQIGHRLRAAERVDIHLLPKFGERAVCAGDYDPSGAGCRQELQQCVRVDSIVEHHHRSVCSGFQMLAQPLRRLQRIAVGVGYTDPCGYAGQSSQQVVAGSA